MTRTRQKSDVGQREWVPAVLAGMKKDYKICKQLKGTAFMLYNFYSPHYKSLTAIDSISDLGLSM